MKAVFTGSRNTAMTMWHHPETAMDDFIDFILANTQLSHANFEGPDVTIIGETITPDTFGPNDGSPTRNTGIDLADIEAARAAFTSALDDHDNDKNQQQRWRLEQLFDDVFISAIRSGLLVEKALVKACEAIEHYDHIAAARDRYIDAQLAKASQ